MIYKKIKHQYYAYIINMYENQKGFIHVPTAVKVILTADVAKNDFFFIHKKAKVWIISHAATGKSVAEARLKNDVINDANEKLSRMGSDKYLSAIENSILNEGLSPQFKLIETEKSPTDAELLDFAMLEMARLLTRKNG